MLTQTVHAPATSANRDQTAGAKWPLELLGVSWVVLAAVAVLVPALRHGSSLGPFDDLSAFGLTTHHGVVPHNTETGDQITEMIPWTILNWIQVHNGHLPLWNSYNALGLPQAFNWQSGSFSLPSLISYLGPLRLVFTVQILVTLVVAGTGAYALSRVLGLGVIAAAFAGTAFELGGAFFTSLGWPLASVAAWSGWILAACVLLLQGRRRFRYVAMLAVSVAGSIYAGQPDMLAAVGLTVTVFVVAMLIQRIRLLGGSGPIGRPMADIVLGAVAGAALAAPLALPGLQIVSASVRTARAPYQPLPFRDLIHLLTQNYDGVPIAGSQWPGVDYLDSAMYVGVLVVVLGVVAVGTHWRRADVRSLSSVIIVGVAVVFVSPVVHLIGSLPGIRHLAWNFYIVPMSLAIAVLGALGLDSLISSWRERTVRRLVASGFLVSVILLAALWIFGRGHLTPHEAILRTQAFVWPVIEILIGLAVLAALEIRARARPHEPAMSDAHPATGRWAGLALVVCETVFLVVAGAPMWPAGTSVVNTVPAVTALQRTVGQAVLGFGAPSCFVPPTLGILPEANILYGIHEFDAYDPITPNAYFTSWYKTTGRGAGAYIPPSAFCPAVTSVEAARLYGIGFVLEPSGEPGPAGSVFVERIGDEALYRIPRSAAATLTPLASDGRWPSPTAPGTPVSVSSPSPATRQLLVTTDRPEVLRLRTTDVPGWKATIDGHPLRIRAFAGVMIEAMIPPGHHLIVLRYWPKAFTVGLACAVACLIAFLVALAWSVRRTERTRGHPRGTTVGCDGR